MKLFEEKQMRKIANILKSFKYLKAYNLTSLKEFQKLISDYLSDSQEEKRLIRILKRKTNNLIRLHHKNNKDENINLLKRIPSKWSGEYQNIFNIEWLRLISVARYFNFHIEDTTEYVNEDENFTKLNIGKGHPGREEHGYFDINRNQFLLRSHSTANHFANNWYSKPAKRLLSLGRVYRNDKDRTHLNAFHQVEILIKENISLEEFMILLKNFLSCYLSKNIDIKIRASFFPFTYLSFEIDITFNNNIYEIAGAGIMMPNIVQGNNQWPALAFGFERLIMIKYGFENIKDCYSVFKLEDVD